MAMGKGKMNGDNSAESKSGHPDRKTRGSGGTTKKGQNLNKNSNNKSANMKSNQH
jgi:hypothetical protein